MSSLAKHHGTRRIGHARSVGRRDHRALAGAVRRRFLPQRLDDLVSQIQGWISGPLNTPAVLALVATKADSSLVTLLADSIVVALLLVLVLRLFARTSSPPGGAG
jgi:uncharacterized membrane protein